MARTVQISKSKALNYKIRTFLYLIFIVFFFFYTLGDFVHHFVPLAKTQHDLNGRLLEKLVKFTPVNSSDEEIKSSALKTLEVLNDFEESLNIYSKSTQLKGQKLTEQRFVKDNILAELPAKKLNSALSKFVKGFPKSMQPKLCTDLGLSIENLNEDVFVKNQILFETPDGAVGSILNHMETVVIFETLNILKQEINDKSIFKVYSSADSSFLQGFKNVYYVGEEIGFNFFSKDSIEPTIKINQVRMTPKKDGRHFLAKWTPKLEGAYELVANIGEEYIRRSFIVIKPSMRFLENDQEIAAFIGEPLTVTVDIAELKNIKDLNFSSNGAEIEQKNDQLILRPLYEGRFTIEMKTGNILLDSKSMFARKGFAPEVVLKDMAGEKSNLSKAHCLESLSPYWQVVNFNMTLVEPNGKSTKTKSNTRYLRNELRALEKNAPEGSTLIFDEIRLLSSNGVSTSVGSPIFIVK